MAYSTIVSTEVLAENSSNSDWEVFDCRMSLTDHEAGFKAYSENHIPFAQYCDIENDFCSPVTEHSGRHPLPDIPKLHEKLGKMGINNNTQVVVYDDANGAYAVRVWWQLRESGHHNVAVLDGGINQWVKEGRELTQQVPNITVTDYSGGFNSKNVITTEQVLENLSSNDFTLLDARSPERFKGEEELIDTIAGRIPNAVSRPFQKNLDENGLFLPADELLNQFETLVADSAKPIVHMCGSGITACHNQLAMEIAGLTGSKVYIGSWSEWIRDKSNPIATG
jgi:thiosulfate/3-mercaptopyruvate sulfurtransferase